MTMNLNERLKLKKLIKKLIEFKGRHTELVSVYIPKNYDLTKIINSLQDEQGTATNIKDAKTSKSVISALERMIRTLKTFKKTPENGLAIFSGNISKKDNVVDFQVFYIEPPEPINLKLYRCDQKFIVYPLEELNSNETTYGLIVIDKSEATIGILIGSTIKVIKELHSNVPGKFKTGGQSAQRFARIREGAAVEFYKRVAKIVTTEFTYMKELKGFIIGGPGTTKNNFFDGSYLNEELKKKVLGLKDITYTNAFGLNELLNKSQVLLAEDEVMTEKRNLNLFFQTLAKNTLFVVYGKENVLKALNLGAVNKLILIDDIIDDDLMEEFTRLAETSKTEIILVTDRTNEGNQFRNLTGMGAILRFPIGN